MTEVHIIRREKNTLSKGILACICAGLFFFYTIFQKVTFNIISVDLISQFHLTVTQLGAVSSAYLYANALWLIPGGVLLEKFSSRAVTLLFIFICAASSFVFAESSSILLDVVMRFIGGLGSAMSLLITLRLAVRWFPENSARVLGILVALGMSAGIVANAPFSYLVEQVGWQNGLLLTGYFGVAIGIFMCFFLHDRAGVKIKSAFSFTRLCTDFKKVAQNFQNWKSGIYIGLMNLPIFILAALWGNLYLIHTAGFTNTQASMIISMIFVGEITGAPIVGFISDKLRNRKLIMLMGAILSLITSLFILYDNHFSISTLSFLFFLLGFFISAQVIGYSVIAESNESTISSTASGFCSFVVNMLGALSQLFFPILLTLHLGMKSTGSSASSYKAAFMMLPVAFFISIIIVFFITETFVTTKKNVVDIQTRSPDEKLPSHS